MAKSVIMLALIRKKLEGVEEDCVKFDSEENVAAGQRARSQLRKTRNMIKSMVDDMLHTSKLIVKSRGTISDSEKWARYKKDGRADKWNKRAAKYLREKRRKQRDAKRAKDKELQNA